MERVPNNEEVQPGPSGTQESVFKDVFKSSSSSDPEIIFARLCNSEKTRRSRRKLKLIFHERKNLAQQKPKKFVFIFPIIKKKLFTSPPKMDQESQPSTQFPDFSFLSELYDHNNNEFLAIQNTQMDTKPEDILSKFPLIGEVPCTLHEETYDPYFSTSSELESLDNITY